MFWDKWDAKWEVDREEIVRTAEGPLTMANRLDRLGPRPSSRWFLSQAIGACVAGATAIMSLVVGNALGFVPGDGFDLRCLVIGSPFLVAALLLFLYGVWRTRNDGGDGIV